jgi:hypothetical protein
MSAKTKMAGAGIDAARVMPMGGAAKAAAKTGRMGGRTLRAMPAKRQAATGAAKGGARAGRRAAESNAYVSALMHDAALHGQLQEAYSSLVKAYDRIASQDDLADALLEDRRTRRHLSQATTSLRGAAETLRKVKARRNRRRGGRVVLLVAVAGGVGALAMSEDLREKLMGLASGSGPSGDQSSNGVVSSAAVENAPPTTTTSA